MTDHHRGRGRPRLDPDAQRPAELRLRVPRALVEELRRIAGAGGVSEWVRRAIEEALRKVRGGSS